MKYGVQERKRRKRGKNVKTGVNDSFEIVLYEWFQQKQPDNIPIDGPILACKG